MANSRKKMKTRIEALFLAGSILACAFAPAGVTMVPAQARTMMPEAVLKKPVSVVENSVSTYVPSSVAPGNGIAVNIIYPEKPRYKAGAPIAIVVSGNESTSLSMSMHAANSGIAEVRFAYPGCGLRQFHSDGIFDNFGSSCNTAVKDVVLFMKGEINDYKGRSVRELIPVSLDQGIVGMVGWETGANIALVTLAKHQDKIPFVSYLAFFEGAAGSMFYPDNLGTVKDMFLNRHYREGSAATGEILVDFRKLMYAPDARRHPGVAKKRGEAELRGVLYFDENNNKVWDEAAEYALSYASEVGLDKQIYAPPIVHALLKHTVFLKSIPDPDDEANKLPAVPGKGAAKAKVQDKGKAKDKNAEKAQAKQQDKDQGKAQDTVKSKDQEIVQSKDKTEGESPAQSDGKEQKESKVKKPSIFKKVLGGPAANKANPENKTEGTAKKNVKKEWWEWVRWPNNVALPQISKDYFDARDGSLYIKQVCASYPKLLVGLFGSQVAHTQRQADHPHIALLYNKFLESKPKWLRLNPEPVYVSTICRMNVNNFTANQPNSSLDAANIVQHLAPLGLVPEYAYMDALVAELSDRAKSGNLKVPLAMMLSDYTPIADPSKAEPPKPDAKPKTVSSKEALGEKDGDKPSP